MSPTGQGVLTGYATEVGTRGLGRVGLSVDTESLGENKPIKVVLLLLNPSVDDCRRSHPQVTER